MKFVAVSKYHSVKSYYSEDYVRAHEEFLGGYNVVRTATM